MAETAQEAIQHRSGDLLLPRRRSVTGVMKNRKNNVLQFPEP
jgi:hypothetical protein